MNPTQTPGVVTWSVNGSSLLTSYIEGTNTEVGHVLTDPARGLTANVTAYDGETLVTTLTIDSSSMLIGTVVACEDNGGNTASTTTDNIISRKKVMYKDFDIIPTRLLINIHVNCNVKLRLGVQCTFIIMELAKIYLVLQSIDVLYH